ncbi:MAG: hypothetical protein E7449_01100 [Ruminococcaceae bacterium]|nr:hypothetical protein [Oscillospiraceae bacterium]
MVVLGKERTLKFYANQDAEDLYRCIETGAVFVRQPCDNEHVRWLTSSKWSGGYEADCPLREGLVLRAIDRIGQPLFQETIIKVDGYMDTVAEKIAPFSYEAIRNLAKDIADRYKLTHYYDWKAWLMKDADAAGYNGYYENWIFDAEYEKPEKIEKLNFLGETVWAVKQRATHCKCGNVWYNYEIRTVDMFDCLAICGYELKEGEEK